MINCLIYCLGIFVASRQVHNTNLMCAFLVNYVFSILNCTAFISMFKTKKNKKKKKKQNTEQSTVKPPAADFKVDIMEL